MVALLSCAIIALSFGLFAAEQAHHASNAQVSAVVDPSRSAERQREAHHTKAREVVDDTDDVILRPFAALIDSHNQWVKRGVPALLGLLVYGLLLLFLARMIKIRSQPLVHYHRAPPSAPTPTGSTPPPGT
jgi:hypothetical protein